jgi:hypothetical protein
MSAFAPILRLKKQSRVHLGGISAMHLSKYQMILIFAASDESTYDRNPILAIHHCCGCRDWAILMQVMEGKEHIITYLSRWLIDTKTRYSFIEKLCLSLFYACSKLRHYLLSSTCIVACQADVNKHMLQQSILSGRIGK